MPNPKLVTPWGKDATFEAFMANDKERVDDTCHYALDDAVMFQPEQSYYGCEGKERKGAKRDFAEIGVDGIAHDKGAPEQLFHYRYYYGGAGQANDD